MEILSTFVKNNLINGMKKIYILALCCAVGMPAFAGAQRFKSSRGKAAKNTGLRVESATPLWRPVSETDYMHDGTDWMELGAVYFKYDNRGNCTEELVDEDGSQTKTETVYNEFNYPVSEIETTSEDGGPWENASKKTYVYDSRVHGFFTERVGYDWTNGAWVKNYSWETNSITRNDDGNIIEVVKALPLASELKPAYKSVWNYGADGKANEYFYYVAEGETEWKLYDDLSYKNIVWEKTDGQLTVFGDLLDLTEGDNLLKSAVVYYNDQPDGHYLVEYSNEGRDFLIKETTNDINEIGRTISMETIDKNGSMRLTQTEYFDEEGNILADPTYISVQEALMDEHGNMIQYTEKETIDGEEEILGSTKYNYTYGSNGNPSEVVTEEYDYDTAEYFPSERIVYGDYIDVAGIGSVKADGAAWNFDGTTATATAAGMTGLTVYSLQGTPLARVAADGASASVSLAGLLPGIYLIHADGTASTYRAVKR